MAGHRRTRGTGRPLQRVTRAQNRRRHLEEALASALTPAQRVHAAAEYVRSTLSAVPADMAGPAADELVGLLVARGDDLNTDNARRNP